MPDPKHRREAERRRLQRQLQHRAQRQAARRRATLIVSILGAIAVIAVVVGFVVATTGEDTSTSARASATRTASPSGPAAASTPPAVPGVCSFSTGGTAVRPATVPAGKAPTRGTVTVSVRTTRGAMTFTLDRAKAPCTVASFVSLVTQKYYDSTPCHRLTTAGIYVLQCGDPTSSGSGGPGYTIPDEATGAETYPAGTIAMARSQGAHTGGSQFFIVYRDSPNLQQGLRTLQYTVFGTVATGLAVVNRVAKAGASTGTDGKPRLAVSITRASVLS